MTLRWQLRHIVRCLQCLRVAGTVAPAFISDTYPVRHRLIARLDHPVRQRECCIGLELGLSACDQLCPHLPSHSLAVLAGEATAGTEDKGKGTEAPGGLVALLLKRESSSDEGDGDEK